MSHLFKRFSRDIIGLVWLSIGIFLSLALVSYSPNDPSLNTVGTNNLISNYCGFFGSFLADICFQLLGVASWILPLSAVRLSVMSFKGRELAFSKLRVLWAVLLLLTTSSLVALYLPQSHIFGGTIFSGGVLGKAVSEGLTKAFNFYGVAVILWTVTSVLMIFYTERPISYFIRGPKKLLQALFDSDTWLPVWSFFGEVGAGAKIAQKKVFEILAPQKKAVATSSGGVGALKAPAGRRFFSLKEEGDEAEEESSFDDESEDLEDCDAFDEPEDGSPQTHFFKGRQARKRKVKLNKNIQRHIENWELPKLSLLEDPPFNRAKVDEKEIRHKGSLLVNKLEQFSVRGEVVDAKPGPAVTMFEFKPNVDVKISKITELADDLSLALSSESVRIIAPIPGRDVVGIETSNSQRETVFLKDILASDGFWDQDVVLPLALGCKADGSQRVVDLRKMPHLMVAGSTGSGKSVFVVSLLTGLLFRHSPKSLRLILIDPKQVDLAAFTDIPHLLMPPVRDPKKALNALRWAIKEMDKRYRSMAKFGARGLESFNEKVAKLSAESVAEHEAINAEFEGMGVLNSYYYEELPYIVIVVEEFGDLMAVDKSNVEQCVVRLAQMARACGIHLILAMQSPRKDVVTGLIKTNIPGRASFKVASKMDSRIILDESGAERLLTRGDMLFLAPGFSKPERHHGPWLTDEEITEVINFWKEQGEPEYDALAMKALEGSGGGYDLAGGDDTNEESSDYDEMYDEILAYVSSQKAVSASLLQRRFRLGYPRAARIIELFESEGVVGPPNGSKPRQVLVNELK